MNIKKIIVVGGGVSGLVCARILQNAGRSVRLLEASSEIGGRVRSDHVDGFILDHGFQVLLDAYPEVIRCLDTEKLQLCPLGAGALIFDGKATRLFADPLRHPLHSLSSLVHPCASVRDKWKLLLLKSKRRGESLAELFSHQDMTTTQAWEAYGFSSRLITQFLRPFYQGVFLDNTLSTSRRMFEFTFSMFSRGDATVPKYGMGEISKQLASLLDASCIQTDARVSRIEANNITLESGGTLEGAAVVRAHASREDMGDWQGVTCVYFWAPNAPYRGPWLALNGSGSGKVNQVAVLSNVSPAYAPPGKSLIAVSLNGVSATEDQKLFDQVKQECSRWFSGGTGNWTPLRIYRIHHALPSQNCGETPKKLPLLGEDGCWNCGDHTTHGSLQGAMESGRKTAEAVLSSI